MDDWWTYTLSDFLLFSPRTYYRLLQRHNESVWPAQLLTLGLGIAIIGLLRQPSPRQGRVVSGILGVLWLWVGWAFLGKRYTTINWAAVYAVPLFAVQALLMVWLGTRGSSFRLRRGAAGLIAGTLLVLGLVLYPVLAPLSGRPWQQAEIFGVMPDPTAVATLGLVLAMGGNPRWPFLVIPLLWCVLSGATLWAMGSPEAWVLLGAALLTLFAARFRVQI